MFRRLLCHLFGHKVAYVFTTRSRQSGRGVKRVVPVCYKCCSRCGAKLTGVSRYWGDPVV